jgi:hypothetical protein
VRTDRAALRHRRNHPQMTQMCAEKPSSICVQSA